jgi:hypothetical protein
MVFTRRRGATFGFVAAEFPALRKAFVKLLNIGHRGDAGGNGDERKVRVKGPTTR